jgi:hypothetical protein
MEEVVPFFKSFRTIFYFKILKLGKVLFCISQSLKGFEFHLNSNFELNSKPPPVIVAQGPLVGDPGPPLF